MQGAISNIEALKKWFYGVGEPFFTLSYYSTQSPTGQGLPILRNVKQSDMDQAWELLKDMVQAQTGFGRAQLNLTAYSNEKAGNNPSGRTNIDIYAHNSPHLPANAPGIGSLPAGYVSKAEIQEILDGEREKWENEARIQALEEALKNPEDPIEKWVGIFERIANTPIGSALIAKISGGAQFPTMVPQPVNGMPSTDNQEEPDEEDIETELDTLEAVAKANGTTLKDLLYKTAQLAKSQPNIVSSLLS